MKFIMSVFFLAPILQLHLPRYSCQIPGSCVPRPPAVANTRDKAKHARRLVVRIPKQTDVPRFPCSLRGTNSATRKGNKRTCQTYVSSEDQCCVGDVFSPKAHYVHKDVPLSLRGTHYSYAQDSCAQVRKLDSRQMEHEKEAMGRKDAALQLDTYH